MNKSIVRGLVLLLVCAASAMSSPLTLCGSVSSSDGSVAFTTSTSDAGGTASTLGGSGTITCTGFTVPAGQTLIGVTVEVMDDALGSTGTSSQVTWTWTYSGEPLTPTPSGTFSEQGNGSGGFGGCTGAATLSCDASANFSTIATYTGGQTTGSFSFSVAPSVTGTGGAGVGEGGSDSAEVLIGFTTAASASGAPEPASLLMIAGGLIGLGVFARRKRRN